MDLTGYEMYIDLAARESISGLDLAASLNATTKTIKRDANPEFDCEAFTQQLSWLERPDCQGDGHYMCLHCKRFDKESLK